MKRRSIWFGAAAVAGLVGAGIMRWNADLTNDVDRDAALVDAFWRLNLIDLTTPDGAALSMQRFRGQKLLVNFWATWCAPCLEELPLLNDFQQKNKADHQTNNQTNHKDNHVDAWQVIGLAVDQPKAVQTWLKAHPVNFPVGVLGLSGMKLSQMMGNEASSLPFSVVFDRAGSIWQRKVGKVSAQELSAWQQLK